MPRPSLRLTAGLAVAVLAAAPAAGLAEPKVSYADGKLQVLLPAADLAPLIDKLVSDAATGYAVNGDSKTAYIKNFRSSFDKDKVIIRLDYDAKTRGWTKNPFGGRVYGPWAKDSGQIQIGVIAKVVDWRLKAYATYRDVKLTSNNWFTNWLMQDAGVETTVNGKILEAVNGALENALGGRTIDLKQVLVKEGSGAVAKATGLPAPEVQKHLQNGLSDGRFDARITPAGLEAMVAVKSLLPNKVEKVEYTLKNDTGRTVKFQMHPSGKKYTLEAGKTFRGTSNEVNDKAPTVTIEETGRTYKLTPGDHRLFWSKSRNRVAFDRDID
jgi:hypothetical protein